MLKKLKNFYRKTFWPTDRYLRSLGVTIGRNCRIASRHFGSEPYLVTVGDHVQITHGVKLYTHGGGWVLRLKQPNFDCFGKISIGNNVYIGNHALIMPGVSIGNDVIIGAGSVVTKSFGDGVIIGGNPAKVIGSITDYSAKMQQYNMDIKHLSPVEKRRFLLSAGEDKFIVKRFDK
jgi:acetyltransferase-like isoleucine patch superfamily enzyme